jgi:hypothetical protein
MISDRTRSDIQMCRDRRGNRDWGEIGGRGAKVPPAIDINRSVQNSILEEVISSSCVHSNLFFLGKIDLGDNLVTQVTELSILARKDDRLLEFDLFPLLEYPQYESAATNL